ncbi:MAG: ABC transporter permease [Actinobacteria bacterium]|nr:ABC transporter permease [Actinomycetota bacterium]
MRKFLTLTIKEIRELLTPQMILPLIITVFIFMFIGQLIGSQAKTTGQEKTRVAFIDKDRSQISEFVKKALEKQNFKVIEYNADVNKAILLERKKQGSLLVFIPENFSENIEIGKNGEVKIYIFLPSFSFAGVQKASKIKAVIQGINEVISNNLIKSSTVQRGLKTDFLKNPVRFKEYVQIGNKQAQGSSELIISFVSNQSAFIPIIMTVVIIISSQSVATAIAAEKENKTLETLLASPVSRSAIALSKMFASGLVALLVAIFYIFGFRYYMNSIMESDMNARFGAEMSRIIEQLNLKLSASDYVLLGLMIFLSVMVALAISIILGSFTDNVKSVQAVITPIMILVLIPYLLTLFVDLTSLPKWAYLLVYLIPFTHTLQAVQNLFFSRYELILIGMGYQLVLFLALLYVIRMMFHSDRILTTRIKMGKIKIGV